MGGGYRISRLVAICRRLAVGRRQRPASGSASEQAAASRDFRTSPIQSRLYPVNQHTATSQVYSSAHIR